MHVHYETCEILHFEQALFLNRPNNMSTGRPDEYDCFSSAAKLPSKKELITSKITVFKM